MPIAGAFIFEFLYRGRAPGDPEPPAYHLILGKMVTETFSDVPTLSTSDTMNVEQATAAGYSLDEILTEINADTLAHNDAQATQITDLQAKLDQANEDLQASSTTATSQASQIETLNAQMAQAKADSDAAAAKAAADLAALQETVDASAATIKDLAKQVADLQAQLAQPIPESA